MQDMTQENTASEKARKMGLRAILFSMMAVGVGQSAVYTIFPSLARSFNFSEIQVSLALSIPALFWGLTSPFWGRLSDRVGRKPVLIFGLSGMTLSMGLLSLVIYFHGVYIMTPLPLFLMLLGSRALFGILAPGTFTSAIGYIADRTSAEERSGGVASITAAFSIGTIFGPGIAAALVLISFTTPFAAMFFLGLSAMAAVYYFVPENRDPSAFDREPMVEKLRWTDKRIRNFLLISFFGGLMQTIIFQVVPFFVIDQMGLTLLEATQVVGTSLMVMGMANVFAQSVMVNHFRLSIEHQFSYGCVTAFIGFAGFFLPLTQITLTLSMFVLGIGFGLIRTAASSAASLSVSDNEQGAVAGLLGSAITCGIVLTPFTIMPLYVNYSYGPYYIALLAVLGSAFYARKASLEGQYTEDFKPQNKLSGPY